MNLNKVFIIGRVTADPIIRKTPNGQSVTNFNIATNRIWTAKDGSKQQETEFHNVVVWGRQAEIAVQFLNKGSLVFIEGRLRTRSWQGKAGETRYTTEIICERLQLGPKPTGVTTIPDQKVPPPETPEIEIPETEIPTIDLEEELDAGEPKEDLPF